MKTKSTQVRITASTDFKQWCDAQGMVPAHPLYFHYRKLYQLGADLNYLRTLYAVFALWDSMHFKQPSKDTRRFMDFFKRYGRELRPHFQNVAVTAIVATVYKLAGTLEAKSVLGKLDVEELVGFVMDAYVQQVAAESKTQPLLWIRARRGNRSDSSGTQFLLILTEHLTQATEKHKPHHAVAAKFLGAIRAQPEWLSWRERTRRSSAISGQSALVRINNWKKDHPDWNDAILTFNSIHASRKT